MVADEKDSGSSVNFPLTFAVIKRYKRLCIVCNETNVVVYTPPVFLRKHIHSRDGLKLLAQQFEKHWPNTIKYIIEFETNTRENNGR